MTDVTSMCSSPGQFSTTEKHTGRYSASSCCLTPRPFPAHGPWENEHTGMICTSTPPGTIPLIACVPYMWPPLNTTGETPSTQGN